MKINSNIQAMLTNNILSRNEERLRDSTERASSGYRINSAKDNPAGMAITNKMNSQIKSLSKATQNSKNAVNAISTAEGSLSEIQDMVQRLSELAVKASNGTMTQADRDAIQKEVDSLKEEIERVSKETEYNTQSLLNGEQGLRGYSDNADVTVDLYNENFPTNKYNVTLTKDTAGKITVTGFTPASDYDISVDDDFSGNTGMVSITTRKGGELKFEYDKSKLTTATPISVTLDLLGSGGMNIQVGSSEGQEVKVVIPNVSLENMGIKDMRMDSEESAKKAMDQLKGALEFVSTVRSTLGAYENRLNMTVSNLNVATENLTGSYSTIKDVDMAEEMVEYTKLQVLVQAGTSMLTQANEQPQQALQLLQ